ncbi:MAG: thioredoxin fold domain-containing protein [Gomphosphaeria aponina SAG 52.96 = DSM 107014]|uniref:Thioredoxin fold domain-containing protein n=1 Tax=Gomphosphaeria aponina SAG 52.96 = DSM 107014 TaxID=1521640 RepID=A0A941GYS6_9CHRO|nr:thioredoxin fold domain-containing protein [Gomphosphaeria aponina SAG 52.96 = DSM 107014]
MSNSSNSPKDGKKVRNSLIALVAIALGISIFLGLQTETGGISLEKQAEKSVPLEIALNNGKPTLTEFYANWCTSCQAMAKDLAELKQQYGEQVNFVMLNVDNSKWIPEVLRYQVDGIPHFVFFDDQGKAIAETIGEQPRNILEIDLNALIASQPLPYTYTQGQVSKFQAPVTPKASQNDPRSHGAQVQM